ncbi:hypothetical protein MKW98_013770, partial [Papaver atlanticum]
VMGTFYLLHQIGPLSFILLRFLGNINCTTDMLEMFTSFFWCVSTDDGSVGSTIWRMHLQLFEPWYIQFHEAEGPFQIYQGWY